MNNVLSKRFITDFDLTSLISVVVLATSFGMWRLQKDFGPRIFMNKFFKKSNDHDYFVSISKQTDVAEGDICSICHTELKQEVAFENEEHNEDMIDTLYSMISKKKESIMRTPCNHFFHISCLITVMNYRQTCPLCRTALPSIEY
jgi:hypothetical protein